MIQVLLLTVLCALDCGAVELPASQWSRKEFQNLTARQHRICVENKQYLHQGLCCLNCKAGRSTTLEFILHLAASINDSSPYNAKARLGPDPDLEGMLVRSYMLLL